MELKTLREIGLTDGEISVYSSLLELGESTKTPIAKLSGVSPSNVYDITNRLLEKGLISKVEKNGVAHFSAANPKHLLKFLDDRKEKIDKEKDLVRNILPNLLKQFQKSESPTNVEVFNGWNGMKTIFEDLLDQCRKGDKNYIFGAGMGENSEQADIFFPKYSKMRAEKGISTYIIYNKIMKGSNRINFISKSGKYNIRFMNQSTPAEIMLYKDKACIIILSDEPLIIRITSKKVTDSFKQYFDVMWGQAKD